MYAKTSMFDSKNTQDNSVDCIANAVETISRLKSPRGLRGKIMYVLAIFIA